MSSPAAALNGLLAGTGSLPTRIESLLDSLTHDERVSAIRSLGRMAQRKLYVAVDGYRPVGLRDLVPPSIEAGATVRHFGRNTLPLFTHFEKRFCRPVGADAERPGELWGFNFQTLQPLTGPGYFVALPAPERPEVWVDYHRIPEAPPAGWPELRRNDVGLSRFVFGDMIDTLRGVSQHVSIGSAARKGRDLGSWFVLCREP